MDFQRKAKAGSRISDCVGYTQKKRGTRATKKSRTMPAPKKPMPDLVMKLLFYQKVEQLLLVLVVVVLLLLLVVLLLLLLLVLLLL